MKNALLDTKSKQKILVTLSQHPRRFFSVKELALRTGAGPAAIRRVMPLFSKHDAVSQVRKRHERYYQINRSSSLFPELSMFFPTKKSAVRDPLERIIASSGDIKFAVLTGVFTGMTDAAADLLLVGKASEKKQAKMIKQLEDIVGVEVNYALIAENEFFERMYSYDWFVKEIMEHDPVILIDKLSKKRRKQGQDLLAAMQKKI